MKRRPEAHDSEDEEPSSPPAFDIFAGLSKEILPSTPVAPSLPATEPVETAPKNSLDSSTSSTSNRLEKPPLNRLVEKYPRFLLYAGIAIAALVIGVVIGIKLSGRR